MITNRFYITTIIAIFLSLSLGILIGGTLGQQWINKNQQQLLSHFEAKSEELKETNHQLEKRVEEMTVDNQALKEDYQVLFTKSITNVIEGKKILWINHTKDNYQPLRETLEISGGIIYELDKEISAIFMTQSNQSELHYDVIIIFPDNEDTKEQQNLSDQYKTPIVYVVENKESSIEKLDMDREIYKQKLQIDSLNAHYQFVFFLKSILKEKSDAYTYSFHHNSSL